MILTKHTSVISLFIFMWSGGLNIGKYKSQNMGQLWKTLTVFYIMQSQIWWRLDAFFPSSWGVCVCMDVICIHACVYMSMCVFVYLYEHTMALMWRSEDNLWCQASPSTSREGLLLSDSPVSLTTRVMVLHMHAIVSGFYMDLGDLSSGPHACRKGSLQESHLFSQDLI